ncbi:MAG: protein-disulfide reductase DsbD family protein [Proteobacteria bacterium]|nr:protein-disulfide reductase DsbD family protein [Pseudomonadota bacterium]
MRRSLIGRNRVLCLLALAILLVAPGVRAAVDTVRTDNVTARLVASVEQVKPGNTVSVMLHQDIREGWHTYWKNPGDSGQETAIEWSLPEGASAAPIQWAAPDRIEFAELVNHGYSNRVGLISDITVPADWPEGTAFSVKAEATWLVCEKVCIPESAAFDITVPTGGATVANSADAALFAAVRGTVPVSAPWPVSATVRGDRISLAFDAPGLALERLSEAHFFAHDWGVVAHAAEQRLSYADGTLQVTLKRGEIPAPEMLSGVLTLREDTGGQSARLAFAIDGVVLAAAAPVSDPMPVAGADGMTLPVILIFAFLGGMLLNLMPCVFPVLAIKALGLVSHAGDSRAGRLRGGLAYMAGVLLAFALLGAVFLALRAGGASIGWGFQLQNPAVVAVLAYILFAVGLNLAGVFEIAGSWTGIGQSLAGRSGATGSFFTGVLAAVVAAPCTAPFMAAALGVAFTQSGPVAMAAILMLGLGLAMPYLLLTAIPGAARLLPRPGAWMKTFKQVLAFPMFASAAWLVWVLAQQADPDAVLAVLLGMTALGFALWLFGQGGGAVRRGIALLSVCGALWLAAVIQPSDAGVAMARTEGSEPFSQARFEALRAEGRPVLVNMTAAWCITCKVNERVALSSDAFHAALAASGTAYLVGDWTREDPEITALLRRYDRAGVPLYVLFYPDARPPQVLPQLLTVSIVVDALQKI